MQKLKLDHQLTPYTKINSKWMKYLKINCNTINVLEGNIGRKSSDIPCSNICTNMSTTARDIKEMIDKWDFTKKQKTKNKKNQFCTAKGDITKMKRESVICENIFANDTLDKGLISKIYKELTQLHSM